MADHYIRYMKSAYRTPVASLWLRDAALSILGGFIGLTLVFTVASFLEASFFTGYGPAPILILVMLTGFFIVMRSIYVAVTLLSDES